ncbi:MAG: DUF721 domain-containing protein [Bacteroidales bacterium]|nr:DUF721 domain-containing protein [Bacteroidales bacterium]
MNSKKRIIRFRKHNFYNIKDPKNIRSVLLESIRDLDIEEKLNEKLLTKFWKELFGNAIINATQKIVLKNKTVIIYIQSSVIKNELLMLREALLIKFKDKFGEEQIKNLLIY